MQCNRFVPCQLGTMPDLRGPSRFHRKKAFLLQTPELEWQTGCLYSGSSVTILIFQLHDSQPRSAILRTIGPIYVTCYL